MNTFVFAEAGNICPLCKRTAICALHDGGVQKHVRCDNCIEFVITCPAEEILSQYPSAFLEQYVAQAKQSNDERLLLIQRPSANSNETVHVKFIQRQRPCTSTTGVSPKCT